MDASLRRNHSAVSALLLAVPFIALLIFAGSKMGDEAGHAASHLAVAVPALLLLSFSSKWRGRAAGGLGSLAHKVVVTGLVLVGGGQVLEAIGAFGFEGYARQYDWLATLHDTAMFSGPPGILLVLIGALLTTVWRMNQRAEGPARSS